MSKNHSTSNQHATRQRQKLWAKVGAIALVLVIAFVKPKVDAWLNQNGAGNPDQGVAANPQDADSGDAFDRGNGELGTLTISDRKKPVTAERPVENSRPSSQSQSSTKASNNTAGSTGGGSTAEKPAEPALGKLTLINGGREEFRSTAGLMYVRGSQEGHRLKHVLKHAHDDLNKPVHGVFDGDRDQILAWIDRAYVRGKAGGKGTRTGTRGDRTEYTVDLGENIGYVGGQSGKRKQNPPCHYLKLVIQNGNEVVTAYPSQSL